jgi:hypothetical protein
MVYPFKATMRALPTMATITAPTLSGTAGGAVAQFNGLSADTVCLQFVGGSTVNNYFTSAWTFSASAEL